MYIIGEYLEDYLRKNKQKKNHSDLISQVGYSVSTLSISNLKDQEKFSTVFGFDYVDKGTESKIYYAIYDFFFFTSKLVQINRL